jgi:hypothetical protein
MPLSFKEECSSAEIHDAWKRSPVKSLSADRASENWQRNFFLLQFNIRDLSGGATQRHHAVSGVAVYYILKSTSLIALSEGFALSVICIK